MLEAISLDSKTLLVKADAEHDLTDIIDLISLKGKGESLQRLFQMARERRVIEREYKFDRDECYE